MSFAAEDPWAERRRRALALAERTPHAREMLTFYAELLAIQGRLARDVPANEWLEAAAGEHDLPYLEVERIPAGALESRLSPFLEAVGRVGTDVVAEASRELLATAATERGSWLSKAARALRDGSEHAAGQPTPFVFLGRAFLEAVLTPLAAAAHHPGAPTDAVEQGRRCTTCGPPPVVAVLGDRADTLGERNLVCSSCGCSWRFPRLVCAGCGEEDAELLVVHKPESPAHVRLEACRSCQRYIKCVDSRAEGSAVPVVDDVATIELDLWARERGLTRLRANVLEL